ncbi:Retrotransposon protein [Dorcoceras hygrometricum]|uniref:Retrotransposon protein n=1 Tax=Dorcoceras hygrometricum TaxID=472368 RepID=A0A2Z6ZR51_9LAMI|nr:Retrotransposon protein [Dorcoceras hygrometricum]
MIGLIEKLVGLDITLPHDLSVDLLLLSLPAAFDPFVVNFNMNKLEATLEEVVNMLVVFEGTIKKDKPVRLMGSSSTAKKC